MHGAVNSLSNFLSIRASGGIFANESPVMEQYNDDIFENVEVQPTIKEIEKQLRKLGCTKEQVRRHVHQVITSRTDAAKEKPKSPRPKGFDWFRA